jgi:outer membrane protein OmpA-like peptidoglycan-associated protein
MRLTTTIWTAAGWLSCGILACAGGQPRALDPNEEQVGREPPPTRGSAMSSERETTVAFSEEIRRECRFPQESAESPHFELDQSTLRGPDMSALDDVASCLKEGPLRDRIVTIVGHADARGTAEHNQQLAESRAEATRNYLIARGVPERRLLVVSRGERDAAGTGEPGYSLDRRVDLVLRDRNDGTLSREMPPTPPANPPQPNVNASPAGAGTGTPPVPPANPPLVGK